MVLGIDPNTNFVYSLRPRVHYKLLVFLFWGLFFFHSPLNHLLYKFFLLRSTIITTTIAAIERIANNPIWAVSPVFTVFTTSTNF